MGPVVLMHGQVVRHPVQSVVCIQICCHSLKQFSGEDILYSISTRVESGRIILELRVARVVLRLG